MLLQLCLLLVPMSQSWSCLRDLSACAVAVCSQVDSSNKAHLLNLLKGRLPPKVALSLLTAAWMLCSPLRMLAAGEPIPGCAQNQVCQGADTVQKQAQQDEQAQEEECADAYDGQGQEEGVRLCQEEEGDQ